MGQLNFCSSDPDCKGSRVSTVVLLKRELKGHTELSDLKNRFKSHWAQKPKQKVKNPPIPDLDMGPPKFLQVSSCLILRSLSLERL